MLLASVATPGCDRTDAATAGPNARSESISVASTTPLTAPSTSASASASAHPPTGPSRKLCEDELAQPGRKLPKGSFTGVAAPGETRPESRLTTDNDKWTWINFFAAWCGPCKEEMPRLRGFQQKLAGDLDVVFVSLDDDERQLKQFLDAQAKNASGVRAALWLQPGKARASWLAGLHLKESPDLPAHVLVDRAGKVRCVAGGAVEDADFATVAAIVKR
jgi:thiol-disulfide isomerase/thioredoxin